MLSEKQKIINWFYRKKFQSGVLEFDTHLIDAVELALSKSRIDAEAYTPSNAQRHWNNLIAQADKDKQKGIIPLVRIVHAPSRRLIWSAYDYPLNPTSKQKFQTELLKSRPLILRKIDALNDRQYESLGCVICRLVGGAQVYLTRPGNEGGIDFFASILRSRGVSCVFRSLFPIKNHRSIKKVQQPCTS